MAGGFNRIEDYDVVDPAVLPDDAVVYTVLPSESTPALIDRHFTWLAFKNWLTTFVAAVAAVAANTTHRSSDGSDHTFIDQDVKVAAGPTFNGGVQTDGTLLKTKVIEIGDWNMVTTTNVNVAHGIADFTTIRVVNAVITNDAGTIHFPLTGSLSSSTTYLGGWINSINSTDVNLRRVTGGFFDGTEYDATSFNRGWVTIEYEV